ncbi:hypothetical protein SAMN05421759_105175 [Roseivivax lentus]|uniref:Uncharacterized protein n=1 Tax=Roseivivax lentus TaxID=633194 RepID=A0A1N7MTE9_9RHOB|nr:hypothetical protein SAMN05421759_105175 [Roseivivax lentus]
MNAAFGRHCPKPTETRNCLEQAPFGFGEMGRHSALSGEVPPILGQPLRGDQIVCGRAAMTRGAPRQVTSPNSPTLVPTHVPHEARMRGLVTRLRMSERTYGHRAASAGKHRRDGSNPVRHRAKAHLSAQNVPTETRCHRNAHRPVRGGDRPAGGYRRASRGTALRQIPVPPPRHPPPRGPAIPIVHFAGADRRRRRHCRAR